MNEITDWLIDWSINQHRSKILTAGVFWKKDFRKIQIWRLWQIAADWLDRMRTSQTTVTSDFVFVSLSDCDRLGRRALSIKLVQKYSTFQRRTTNGALVLILRMRLIWDSGGYKDIVQSQQLDKSTVHIHSWFIQLPHMCSHTHSRWIDATHLSNGRVFRVRPTMSGSGAAISVCAAPHIILWP